MDGYLILAVHLVELINAANTVVGEHQGTGLYTEVSSFWVLNDTSRKTCSTRGFSTGVNGARKELTDVFQELGFGSSWITYDANIDVTTKFEAFLSLFLDTTEELQENSLLNIQMSMNIWCDRVGQFGVEIVVVLHLNCSLSLLGSEILHNIIIPIVILLVLSESESGVAGVHGASNEDKLIAEVFNSDFPQAGYGVKGAAVISLHISGINILTCVLLSRLQKLNDIRDDDKLSCEDGLVSGFGKVNSLTPKDDIDRSWH